MKQLINTILIIFILIFFLAACENRNTSSMEPTNKEDPKSYPFSVQGFPQESNSENNKMYPPIENSSGYPFPPTDTPLKISPEFDIKEPVIAGSVQVTGTGPPNVTITLIDVSEMGMFLAETTIDTDGQFLFDLAMPLLKSHSIGLQIKDISKTDYDYEDFIYSENYIDRPFIGIILDMVTVE